MPRITLAPPSVGGLSECRDVVKRGIDLCRLTRSPAELASVAAFVSREVAARLVGVGDGAQALLRLQDGRFAVGFGTGETQGLAGRASQVAVNLTSWKSVERSQAASG